MEEITKKEPLLVLTGPTAVGKTELSLMLAEKIGGEIISADSMQVYKYMDIGSAKISHDRMRGIPHHLINVLDPKEEFNVFTFQRMALEAIRDIHGRGKIPILTGGTGFYIQSVLYNIDFTEEGGDREYRRSLEELAAREGPEKLHRMLEEVDSRAAAQIHPNNVKRVIRALEYHEQTGGKISEHNEKERGREAAFNACYFVLTMDRQRLYDRIDRRVDQMLSDGLVKEVDGLRCMGCSRSMVSMKGLGYKEILGCLEGEYDLEQAVYLIKRDTRHFAKRQLTWFRREKDVIWLDRDQLASDEECLAFILNHCRERNIL